MSNYLRHHLTIKKTANMACLCTKNLIFVVFLLLLVHSGQAQEDAETIKKQKFNGGISVGFQTSQIQGDQLGGYAKIGGTFGAFTYFELPKSFSIQIEISYDQFGSAAGKNQFSQIQKIATDYLNVTLLGSYKYQNFSIVLGHSLATLVRFKTIDISGADISALNQEGVRRFNWLLATGLKYHISEHFAAGAYFRYSLVSAFSRNANIWKHNGLGFRLDYIF